MDLSVIVPVGKEDDSWKILFPDFLYLDRNDEIIFVSPNSKESELEDFKKRFQIKARCRWVQSSLGRSTQLNFGARHANREFLWFLHCDSRISKAGVEKLKTSIAKFSNHILFFNLKFLSDGSRLTFINEIGAWLRSRVLRLPFGDQGLCMSKKTFDALGGFDERAVYGEDHLLIWRAHQTGISIRCIGGGLKTSARKYQGYGWFKTTLRHIKLTYLQAAPEFYHLLFRKKPV